MLTNLSAVSLSPNTIVTRFSNNFSSFFFEFLITLSRKSFFIKNLRFIDVSKINTIKNPDTAIIIIRRSCFVISSKFIFSPLCYQCLQEFSVATM